MTFTYYGNEIKVSEHGYFEATIDGRSQTKQTLAELKEWIDKEIAANVKKITISLPVCAVVRPKNDIYNTRSLRVIRTVITGVNRQMGTIQCQDTPSGFECTMIVPDSDENFSLCERYIAANKTFNALQRAVRALHIDGSASRIDAPRYQGVLDTLTRKHSEKVAEGAKVHEAVAKWDVMNGETA